MADSSDLDRATARLDRALSMLETRLRARKARAVPQLPAGEDDLFAALEAAGRQRELEAAAEDAVAALGRAADEMRLVLKGAA